MKHAVLALAFLIPLVAAAAPEVPEGTRVLKDLPYVAGGHPQQKLDLYLPAEPTGPLLVWIHGGGWQAGSKDEVQGLALLERGYALASVGYRFSQHAVFPAQAEDCKAAVRWLRARAGEYGYNAEQIAAWGASAGGHLVALLAVTGDTREFDVGGHLDESSAIRCGIDFFGPTDFPGWEPPSEHPLVQTRGEGSCLVRLLGGPLAEKAGLARRASPLHWADAGDAPLYLAHGTTDPLVGPEQSERLADKLEAAGVPVVLDIIEGAGHGGVEFFSHARLERMVAFLTEHLSR